jgi:hypothetical protein
MIQQAMRIRIYFSEHARSGGALLSDRLIGVAQAFGAAGLTLMRAEYGFGAHRHVHSNKLVRLAENLPVVAEIVDCPEIIQQMWNEIAGWLTEGLMTREEVEMEVFSARPEGPLGQNAD